MIAYYDEHGMLTNVFPRHNSESLYDDRDIAYHATIVCIGGFMYDLTTPTGYAELPIPNFKASWDVLNLAYIMKIHCSRIDDPQLIPAAVEKTLALMRESRMLWRRRDYLQVIRNYYRVGLFDDGDIFECKYRKDHPLDFSKQEDEKQEAEHQSTKAYFRSKWEKKHKNKGTSR